MANILNKMLDFVGWEAEEEDFYEEEDVMDDISKQEFQLSPGRRTQGKVLSLNSNSNLKVIVVQPQDINDAKEVCDHLRANKPIVMNVEDIDTGIAQRIVDFLSGAVYSLDGNIQKISSGIFLATPNNIDILGDFKDDLKQKGVFPWVK